MVFRLALNCRANTGVWIKGGQMTPFTAHDEKAAERISSPRSHYSSPLSSIFFKFICPFNPLVVSLRWKLKHLLQCVATTPRGDGMLIKRGTTPKHTQDYCLSCSAKRRRRRWRRSWAMSSSRRTRVTARAEYFLFFFKPMTDRKRSLAAFLSYLRFGRIKTKNTFIQAVTIDSWCGTQNVKYSKHLFFTPPGWMNIQSQTKLRKQGKI